MPKIMLILADTLGLLAPAKTLELWGGAKVGQSLDDIRRQFPGAHAPARTTSTTGGEADQLQLDRVRIGGRVFVAHFLFKTNALDSVQLTLADLPAGATQANKQTARDLSADLSGAFGAGFDCGDRSFSDINVFECKWLKPPLLVRLWYMDVAGQAPVFYIAYGQAGNLASDL